MSASQPKKLTLKELATRSAAVSAGHKRLAEFLDELRDTLDPLLKKYQLTIPAADLLHHRHASDSSAYLVLHFYVFAPPPNKEEASAADSQG